MILSCQSSEGPSSGYDTCIIYIFLKNPDILFLEYGWQIYLDLKKIGRQEVLIINLKIFHKASSLVRLWNDRNISNLDDTTS